MAKTWTGTRGIGNYGSQIKTVVTLLSQDRAANTSRLRVVVSIYNGGRSRSWDSSVGMAITGTVSFSGTGSVDVAGYSWQTIISREFTVTHGSDGRKSFTINGVLGTTGTSTFGSGGTASVSGTLPQLLLAPLAPVNLLANRVSDTAQRLTWGNRTSARRPYTRLQVQRAARSGGGWQYVSTSIGASAQSYQDGGTKANDRYDYRVRAVNSVGASPWARNTDGTSGVSTTPASPASVTAKKSGSNIVVTWADRADTVYLGRTFLIEDSPNGGAWTQVGTVTGSRTTWTHSNPNASQTHRYRVRARITERGNTLTSGYSSASNLVQLLVAPMAPTPLSPADGSSSSSGTGSVKVQWRHAPLDTTEQEAAEVQYRQDGGAWNTITVAGATDHAWVPVSWGVTGRAVVEWQVRTRGEHPNFGRWSIVRTFVETSPPFVAVQAPESGSQLDTSRVTVSWAYDPAGTAPELAQSAWEVSLYDADGGLLEAASGTGRASSARLAARLTNGSEYRVVVQAQNGDGVWSPAEDGTVTFTTSFPVPPELTVAPEWSRDLATVELALHQDEAEPLSTYRWTGDPHASTSERVTAEGVNRVNLATNPSLEAGLAQVGMTQGSSTNGRVSLSSEWALTGSQSVRIDPAEGSNGDSTWYVVGGTDAAAAIADQYAMRPGEVFTVGATIHLDAPQTGELYYHARAIRVNAHGSDGSHYWGAVMSDAAPNEAGDHRVVVTFTVPPEADGGVTINLCNGSATGPVWWDGLTIEKGVTPGTYFDGETPVATDTVFADVERNDGDGWTLVASGIDPTTRITDRTPRIGDVRYRAISRTVLPTEQTGPEAVASWVHDRDPVYVSGGDGWSRTCTARGADASDKATVEQELQQFAGSPVPVAFFGEARGYETTFTGSIWQHPLYPVSTREDWVALLYEAGLVCFRDCRGRKVFGLLDVDFSTSGPSESVSITVQQARHTEGVARVSDAELESRILAGG